MRILWASNAPWAGTGYGQQTRLMLRHLLADGHEVAVAANWGMEAGTVKDPESGVPVFPRGKDWVGNDVLPAIYTMFRADWLISLYDVWAYRNPKYQHMRFASWTPIDRHPVPPDVFAWAKDHYTIAMSRWGQERLALRGVKAQYAPHALDLSVFRPTESDFRQRVGIPADAFLVVINAANKGKFPPRKAWGEMLYALAQFMGQHDDAWVYLHTDLEPVDDGIDLALAMFATDIPAERVRVADQVEYRLGMIADRDLAEIYSAADVLLATSMGEGFGIPVIEAQACGTPVIVTDFSAQTELVGPGWKVSWQPYWDPNQAAFLAMPMIAGIHRALTASYDERGTRRDASVAFAAQYESGKVYDEHWRPILAELQALLTPPTRQQRRAKRRAA